MFFHFDLLVQLARFKIYFKVCVRYFLSNFYFSPNDSSLKIMENVLFRLESSFRSRDIQVLVFSSSHFFLPVSHCCFRG